MSMFPDVVAGAPGHIQHSNNIHHALRRGLVVSTSPEEHGAVHDGATDDSGAITAAINQAVADCIADGSYVCEVVFTPGIYAAARALQQGGTPKANAQIPLPMVSGQAVTLRLRGRVPQSNAGGLGRGGAVIRSTLMAQTYDVTYGRPSVIGGPTTLQMGEFNFNSLRVIVENVTVVCPDNPSVTAFDFSQVAQVDVVLARAATNVADYNSITTPSNAQAAGLCMPRTANFANCRVRDFWGIGFFAGLQPGEHTYINQYVSFKNKVGLAPHGADTWNTHSVFFDLITTEQCAYTIAGVDPSSGVIPLPHGPIMFGGLLDVEDGSVGAGTPAGLLPVNHLHDPNNVARGSFSQVVTIAGTGAGAAWNNNGGAYVSAGGGSSSKWIAPTFQNSWADSGLAGYLPVGYRRGAFGAVELAGVAKGGTINTTSTIFTLPAQWRPPTNKIFSAVIQKSDSTFATGWVQAGTDGSVIVGGGNFGAGILGVFLDNMRFYTDS